MCRPRSTYFSTSSVSSPKELAASRRAAATASASSPALADHPHPLAATAGRGLDQHGEAQVLDRVVQGVRRHHGHAGLDRDLAGGVLAAHLLHHVEEGPTSLIPASSTARANAARSERKP